VAVEKGKQFPLTLLQRSPPTKKFTGFVDLVFLRLARFLRLVVAFKSAAIPVVAWYCCFYSSRFLIRHVRSTLQI